MVIAIPNPDYEPEGGYEGRNDPIESDEAEEIFKEWFSGEEEEYRYHQDFNFRIELDAFLKAFRKTDLIDDK